jgi:DNA-binding transcriptional MerR regulator
MAIHSYQRIGLVPKPRRIAGNLQLHHTDDVSVVVFVQRALGLGFSPQAVLDLLRLANTRQCDGAEVHISRHCGRLLTGTNLSQAGCWHCRGKDWLDRTSP